MSSSTSAPDASNGRNGGPKSVRFAESVDKTSVNPSSRNKRPHAGTIDSLRDIDVSNGGDSNPPIKRIKRPREDRPNPDEDDDIDDWEPQDDDQDASGLPDTKLLLQAKRERRLRREGILSGAVDEKDDRDREETHIDSTTSLLAEKKGSDAEIPVEAFNMDAERTDGSGYFDGDTYVFRNRSVDEEPDAWLESLSEGKETFTVLHESSEDDSQNEIDKWRPEELYAKLIPLLSSDKETVLQALSRCGFLLKRHGGRGSDASSESEAARRMAKTKFSDLTEAANALLLKGDADVYQKTRVDMMQLVAAQQSKTLDGVKPEATTDEPVVVQWEYRGNQDHQIHGLFSTQQMIDWIQAGYFIGPQAVQIRPVSFEQPKGNSAVDDLLSDLMDDEQNNDSTLTPVRGEWMSSDHVNFASYS